MRAIAIGAIFLAVACAQEFEVASVRVNNSGSGPSSGVVTRAGRVTGANVTLKRYILNAYGLNDFQVAGPDWIDSERYDIQAKGPEGSGSSDIPPMLQRLLADRFKLKIHRENRMIEAYEMTIASGGVRFKETGAPGDASTNDTSHAKHGHLVVRSSSMEHLAEVLSRHSERPVVDRTGLKGRYDFTLDWAIDESDTSAPSLFTSTERQLGLKLQARKIEMEIVVVDSALRVPTEN